MKTQSKAIFFGLISALFSLLLLSAIDLWHSRANLKIWSAASPYFWMALPLFPIVLGRGEPPDLFRQMRSNLRAWIVWSTIGFGFFYDGLTYVSSFALGWLVASTWQITILASMCLSPLLGNTDSRPIGCNTVFF